MIRLETQTERILTLLKLGPRTNTQLSEIALKYTSRISDLRAQGYSIACDKIGNTGLTVYTYMGKNANAQAA
jgi:hypothetical protein